MSLAAFYHFKWFFLLFYGAITSNKSVANRVLPKKQSIQVGDFLGLISNVQNHHGKSSGLFGAVQSGCHGYYHSISKTWSWDAWFLEVFNFECLHI